ncbi:hypothetical protein QFZ64_005265 [Streptomyces sp. B3I8]|nr:hypothetical protein [Streptomyces sp. B3I8]
MPTTSVGTAAAPTGFHHRAVGDLILAHGGMGPTAEPGPTLTACAAEPGSPSEERLRPPASLAATDATEATVASEGAAPSAPRRTTGGSPR